MKIYLSFLLIILYQCPGYSFNTTGNRGISSIAGSQKKYQADSTYRNGNIYFTIGILEIVGIGIGYQLNDKTAIGIKYGGYWLSHFNGGAGPGIKVTQYTGLFIIPMINVELILHTGRSDYIKKPLIHGFSLDVNAGYDNFKNRFFNVIWSLGVAGSFGKGSPPIIGPNLKIGLGFNW